jgi:hypothetical protein
MDPIAIDWSTAQVRERELRVAFAEPISKPERERMTVLVRRLERPGEPWKTIAVKKTQLIVGEIADGAEDAVRHFLESLLLEVNAATADDDADGADREQVDKRDQRMTDAFRSFAPDASQS